MTEQPKYDKEIYAKLKSWFDTAKAEIVAKAPLINAYKDTGNLDDSLLPIIDGLSHEADNHTKVGVPIPLGAAYGGFEITGFDGEQISLLEELNKSGDPRVKDCLDRIYHEIVQLIKPTVSVPQEHEHGGKVVVGDVWKSVAGRIKTVSRIIDDRACFFDGDSMPLLMELWKCWTLITPSPLRAKGDQETRPRTPEESKALDELFLADGEFYGSKEAEGKEDARSNGICGDHGNGNDADTRGDGSAGEVVSEVGGKQPKVTHFVDPTLSIRPSDEALDAEVKKADDQIASGEAVRSETFEQPFVVGDVVIASVEDAEQMGPNNFQSKEYVGTGLFIPLDKFESMTDDEQDAELVPLQGEAEALESQAEAKGSLGIVEQIEALYKEEV